jgi:ABC-type branched-subunit amino acid transport system substrate-binding protein
MEFEPIVKQVVATQPQAIIVVGGTPATAKFLPMIRAAGSRAQIVSLSNNATSGFIKALDGLDNFDLGGVKLSFGPNDHTGLEFTDISIIDVTGKFRR